MISIRLCESYQESRRFAELVVAKVRVGLIEAKKLVVDGVDIVKKLNELSAKVQDQQKEIEELQKTVEEMKKH